MGITEIIEYYVKLLIIQYRSKPKASAHVRAFASESIIPELKNSAIGFSSVPSEGFFEIGILLPSDNYAQTVSIGFSDSAEDIQTAIRALSPELSLAVVMGSIGNAGINIIFNLDGASLDTSESYFNSLKNAQGASVAVSLFNNDRTIPIAIQNAYNIDPSLGETAKGAQLDVLGKYVGVTRRVRLLNGQYVDLNDSDMLAYIRLCAVITHLGSPLRDIDEGLNASFPDVLYAVDNFDMSMDYLVNNELVSGVLLDVLIAQNKLPKPMGVRLSNVIYAPPITKLFSFSSYEYEAPEGTGFNSYDDYNTDTHFLSYADSVYPI